MDTKMVTSESLLQRIGSFGLYQKLFLAFAFYAVLCWGTFPSVFFFLIAEPRWECVKNSSVCNITGTVGAGESNYDYRCGIARDEWAFVDDYTSLVTQFGLVCEKSVYGKHLNTIKQAGFIVGSFLGGLISDWLGRKKMFFLAGLVFSASLFIIAFSSSFLMPAILVFFLGAGHASAMGTAFVWVVEYVGIQHRSMMTNGMILCYGTGLMILSGIAYVTPEWKLLTLIISLCGVPAFAAYCLVPESLRWMIVKKKEKQAVKTLRQIAKINKRSLEDDIELPNIESEVSSGDVRLMFKSGYARDTLVLWYCWMVNAMVYDSVHLSAPDIGGSLYVNWCLSGASEFLGTLVSIYVHNRLGRKKSVIVGELMAALCTLGAVILTIFDNGNAGFLVGKVLLSIGLAKFFIVISYNAIALLTAEYYPTQIRNVAFGLSVSLSSIGGIVAGYVTHLIRVHPLLPHSIFAVNAMLSAFLCFSLKETNNKPILEVLPQEEVKEVGLTNQTMLDVLPQEEGKKED